MAYFGLQPLQSTYLTDYFSGNGSTVAFTLSRAPIAAESVLVHISGVKQHASTYGVAGTTLTFSAAPPTGTNNIEVLHLGIAPETVTLPSYRTITEFTATAGQTTFSPASYTVGYIDVYRNGVKLGAADFTATNGTTVVLANACTAGDYVRFEGFLITSFNDAIPNTAGAVSDSLVASVSASKLTGSRTLPNSVVPAGSVIQVVSNDTVAAFSTTSTSFVTTGITGTITPSSASSKILVFVNLGSVYNASTSGQPRWTLYRGATNLGGTAGGTSDNFGEIYNSAGGIVASAYFSYLDSPSTTSSTTYTVYMRTNLGTAYTGFDTSRVSVTMMEIAA